MSLITNCHLFDIHENLCQYVLGKLLSGFYGTAFRYKKKTDNNNCSNDYDIE